jgi:hypothetical protein
LPLVELTFQTVQQLCVVDQELNQRDRTMLRLDSDSREPRDGNPLLGRSHPASLFQVKAGHSGCCQLQFTSDRDPLYRS